MALRRAVLRCHGQQPRPGHGVHNRRHELRRLSLARQRLARLPAPGEHLLRRQTMPPRNLRNDRARNKRLFNNAGLVILRESAPPPRPRDYLQPAHRRRLRLKRMVKRRHKPIPIQRDRETRLSHVPRKGGSGTTLTNEACRRSNFLTIRFQDVLAAQQVIQLLFIGNVLNLVFYGMWVGA